MFSVWGLLPREELVHQMSTVWGLTCVDGGNDTRGANGLLQNGLTTTRRIIKVTGGYRNAHVKCVVNMTNSKSMPHPQREKSKFSDPSLIVACPSCGVPSGCACRIMDTRTGSDYSHWAAPREPHLARLAAYSRWKVKTFSTKTLVFPRGSL